MPDPLHHSTLAAITRLAQERGLPIVRADDEVVIVGDAHVERWPLGWVVPPRLAGEYPTSGHWGSALLALRHALGEGR
jgi:hypothetical protein